MAKSTHAAHLATKLNRLNSKMREIEADLLSSLDEEFFFGRLARVVKGHFSCDRVIVFKSMEDGSPVFVSDTESPGATPYILEKGKGVSGHVIRTSRPYYSNNSSRDPVFNGVKESKGFATELCVPVVVSGQVMATIHLQNKNNRKPFSQRDINDVKAFLDYFDRPLHNMKMYLTAKHLNEVLREEVQQKDRKLQSRTEDFKDPLYYIRDFKVVGRSTQINGIFNMIPKLAQAEIPILIEGASGVGKEVIAKRIHLENFGEHRPFVAVNCATFTEETFDREMFGYIKGTSFGASAKKGGLCDIAHGGTLFLDNIGELSPSMQVSILRFLETRKVFRIGFQEETEVDVRIVAAHNGPLRKEVEGGCFREDLYFILKGFTISVPTLKERKGDIEPLACFFLNQGRSAMDHKQLAPEALVALKGYSWPGNVRELKNAMERAFLMSEGKAVGVGHLPDEVLNHESLDESDDYTEFSLQELEERHIVRTLELARGNKTRAARTLGITVKTLYNKLHNYGMVQPRVVENFDGGSKKEAKKRKKSSVKKTKKASR